MLRRHPHRKLTAWFAMLAIGLLALAPTASRVLAAATGAQTGGIEHAHVHASHGDGHDSQHADGSPADGQRAVDQHADHLEACGYCSLAAHGSTLSDAVAYSVPVLPAAPLAVAMDRRHVPPAAVRHAPARGPPVGVARLGG